MQKELLDNMNINAQTIGALAADYRQIVKEIKWTEWAMSVEDVNFCTQSVIDTFILNELSTP